MGFFLNKGTPSKGKYCVMKDGLKSREMQIISLIRGSLNMNSNPLTIVFRSLPQKSKQEFKINDLYYRVKLGLVVTH